MSYWTINETSIAAVRMRKKLGKKKSNLNKGNIMASINNSMIQYGDEDSNIGFVC